MTEHRRMRIISLAGMASVLLFTACSKDIQLNLPVYEPKMVVEFYLEDNKPIRCLLQESINFTDTAQFKLVDNALVVLGQGEEKDTLINTIAFDLKFRKIFNYYNPEIIRLQPGMEYDLYVRDGKGREMRAKTRLNNPVPIDTLIYNFNAENKAAVGLILNDKGDKKNHYRIVAYKDTVSINPENIWDITFTDDLFNGRQFSFYTGYAFHPGDTVVSRLYHLTEEHNNFTESVNNAQSSNGNPFGQPANIITNIIGGTGVFTTVNYAEKTIIIK